MSIGDSSKSQLGITVGGGGLSKQRKRKKLIKSFKVVVPPPLNLVAGLCFYVNALVCCSSFSSNSKVSSESTNVLSMMLPDEYVELLKTLIYRFKSDRDKERESEIKSDKQRERQYMK